MCNVFVFIHVMFPAQANECAWLFEQVYLSALGGRRGGGGGTSDGTCVCLCVCVTCWQINKHSYLTAVVCLLVA